MALLKRGHRPTASDRRPTAMAIVTVILRIFLTDTVMDTMVMELHMAPRRIMRWDIRRPSYRMNAEGRPEVELRRPTMSRLPLLGLAITVADGAMPLSLLHLQLRDLMVVQSRP